MKDDYLEYIERQFCKEYPCAIEKEMLKFDAGSNEYNRVRNLCNGECLHTAKEFQNWLKKNGYVIIKPKR